MSISSILSIAGSGFTCDEPLENLGLNVMVSPQFEQDKDELVAQLGYLKD